MRHQHAAQHLGGIGRDLVHRLDHSNPALGLRAKAFKSPLAAPAGMDLGLHDEDRTPQLLGGLRGLSDGEGREALGDRHTELGEDGFGLVFVDVHEARDLAFRRLGEWARL